MGTKADDLRVGANVLVLADRIPEWITRRVETVEYLDHAVARRTVRVDLDLEAIGDVRDAEKWPRVGGRLLVPVAMLQRRSLTSAEVVEEGGGRMPLLNKTEERRLLQDGLTSLAKAVLKEADPSAAITEQIASLVQGDPPEPGDPAPAWADAAAPLMSNRAFQYQLYLVRNYYLLVVPIDPDRAPRRVVTFSYIEDVVPPQNVEDDNLSPAARTLMRFRWIFNDIGERFVYVHAPSAGDSASYHLQVPAPYDLEISEGRLVFEEAVRGGVVKEVPDRDRLRTHAHVYLSKPMPLKDAWFTGLLRLSPSGLVRAAPLSALFVVWSLAGAMLYTMSTDDWLFENGDPNSASSLFLLVPGAVAALIATPSKHSMTTRLLFPTRLLLWVTGIASFAGAYTIAVGLREWLAVTVWLVAVLISAGCCLALARQYNRLRAGRSPLRTPGQ